MAIGSKVSGDFKSASGLFAKVDGGWKKAKFGYVKVNGQWKQFWAEKLEDTFNRVDTTSGLGTSDSGQAWTILRSQWQINSNNAKTTGSKSDYPLASIDTGFLNFELEANELTPGTGVAVRVTDANNWWAVTPYYNQIATQYSYCVAGHQQSYCISQCPDPAGYNLVCNYPNQETTEYIYGLQCVDGYYEPDTVTCVQTYCDPPYVEQICSTTQQCTSPCIRYCYQTGSGVYCCDRDYVCKDVTTCRNKTFPGDCYCIEYDTVYGDFVCTSEVYGLIETITTCAPDGYDNVPYYDCCQAGSYFVCDQSATGTSYSNYYYMRIVKMENGVLSVVADIEVPERWGGLKISASGTTLTATAYKDNAYTQQVGTTTVTSFNSAGTGYGVAAIPSNFEDGRTIASLIVKPLGQ